MLVNEPRKKSQCPHCKELVHFDNFHTRTYDQLAERKEMIQIAVNRCPECKRLTELGHPFKDQRQET